MSTMGAAVQAGVVSMISVAGTGRSCRAWLVTCARACGVIWCG
ncbi:MAG TPA: hypothetical protein VFV66_21720 [Nonomuraea sp.]|nr:hypothetical protein [Nonomuraea sp.]